MEAIYISIRGQLLNFLTLKYACCGGNDFTKSTHSCVVLHLDFG
jgi:hypothetical protein